MRHLYIALLLFTACGKQGDVGPAGPAGERGAQGIPGINAIVSAYSIDSVIDPCGDAPGVIDEVLLKLHNGQLLVSFSDNTKGDNTRFAILSAGNYHTTDGSNCNFSVDSLGNVTF